MFADPQSVTLSGTALSFPRVGSGLTSGVFQNDGYGHSVLTISHAIAKRGRHVVRLDNTKIAVDPLQPATNKPFSMSTYLVVDAPLAGFSVAEQGYFVAGLRDWLTASSGANIAKLIGGES
jgi:hypothetical protein